MTVTIIYTMCLQCVCLSVCLSVCWSAGHVCEPCKNGLNVLQAEPIKMPFGLGDLGGPKERCITWGPDPSRGKATFGGCLAL